MSTYNVSGTYTRSGYVITVTAAGAWEVDQAITIAFDGAATDGIYQVVTGGVGSFTTRDTVSGSITATACTVTVTGTNPALLSDIQKLNPGSIVELFELDATALGGGTFRFTSGVNELGEDIAWQDEAPPINRYTRFPIEAEGFEWSGKGVLPQPKIKVANINGIVSALCLPQSQGGYDDLIGAKVIRRRTFVKYLDAVNFSGGINATADPTVHFPDEVWYVERKSAENRIFAEFELSTAFDLHGTKLPRRQFIQNVCTWTYKGEGCGFVSTPPNYWTYLDVPTVISGQDVCGKRLTSCKLRFGANASLPFGGFPGLMVK